MEHLLANGRTPMKRLKGIEFKYNGLGALAAFIMNLFIYLTVGLRILVGLFSAGRYDMDRARAALEEAGFEMQPGSMDMETSLYKDFDPSGVEISGGEAQKIAIARALYKQAPVLVLDEPTTALDPQAEYEVYKNLNHVSENRTAIFISHRMSSCRFCDRILVFDEGRLVQQ